jgi:hypothetical protein
VVEVMAEMVTAVEMVMAVETVLGAAAAKDTPPDSSPKFEPRPRIRIWQD